MSRQFQQFDLNTRIRMKTLLVRGTPAREIGKELGYSRSSIYNEIKRGSELGARADYDPYYAEACARQASKNKGQLPIFEKNKQMAKLVAKLVLEEKMSIPKIAEYVSNMHDAEYEAVSINTIYKAIDLGLIPGVTRDSLLLQKNKMFSGGNIHIPSEICERFGFHDGDIFKLDIVEDGRIIICKEIEK